MQPLTIEYHKIPQIITSLYWKFPQERNSQNKHRVKKRIKDLEKSMAPENTNNPDILNNRNMSLPNLDEERNLKETDSNFKFTYYFGKSVKKIKPL
jgi:hypothetical protein